MKLKYYLRGVGIGIIFATLVMTLSSVVHKYNLSDEYIIKEAMKLGMVMKDDNEGDDSIWGSGDTEEDTALETEEDTALENEGVESTPVAGSETDGSEDVSEITSESTSESESASESQTPTHITIVVERGDYARQVAEKLFAAGLIDDAEEFRKYMGNHGYAKTIHAGTYSIPVGATYEEICKIVAG